MRKPSANQDSPKNRRFFDKKRRRRWNKTIRRIHMYLGLTLVPWLFLYGTTALLFNHGDWFTDRTSYTMEPIEESFFPEP